MFSDTFKIVRLSEANKILHFNCDNKDLNEFLLKDAVDYADNLLEVTYLFEVDTRTLAFFSLINDKISLEECFSKNNYKSNFTYKMPKGMKHNSFPAVKLGRLAVTLDMQYQGIGTSILDYLKLTFALNNRTGCRYITVDAFEDSLTFYEKNGFEYFLKKDKHDQTRSMYFDLDKVTKQ